ncbi:hypothetical protein BDR06DRAFT_978102 [Suillus hirtellus]|nr:hypothetical protein BDR06DRAFT_978102 [Suillus hirtellus]
MSSSEAAKNALNSTLAAVQPLIKCYMKLKKGDPEALKLSDDIARCVAKDLRIHAGDAALFSPQLLSCAAIIWQYSKGGAFQHIPNWTSDQSSPLIQQDHVLRTCSMVKSKGLGFSSCTVPLTRVHAPNFRRLSNNIRRLLDNVRRASVDVQSPMSDAREFRRTFGNKR